MPMEITEVATSISTDMTLVSVAEVNMDYFHSHRILTYH